MFLHPVRPSSLSFSKFSLNVFVFLLCFTLFFCCRILRNVALLFCLIPYLRSVFSETGLPFGVDIGA